MGKQSAADWAREQKQGGGGMAIKLPEGTEKYKLAVGENVKLDILPYIVKVGTRRCDEGLTWWGKEYWIHWVPAPGGKNKPFLCLFNNWGEPCPICNFKTHDQVRLKSMRCKHRMMMNVADPEIPVNKRKIQILDISATEGQTSGFLVVLLDRVAKKERYKDFYELTNGYTLEMTVAKRSFPGKDGSPPGEAIEPISIDLEPREDYPKEWLKKVVSLDDLLVKPDPEKIKALLYEGVDDEEEDEDQEETPKTSKNDKSTTKKSSKSDDEDDDDDKPVTKKKPTKDEDDEDDLPKKSTSKKQLNANEMGIVMGTILEYEDEEFAVAKVSKDGTSITLTMPSGQSLHVGPDEVKIIKNKTLNEKGKIVPISDDDDDIPPKKSTTKKKVDPEDDEDDEDDDLPTTKKTAPKRKTVPDDDDEDDDD